MRVLLDGEEVGGASSGDLLLGQIVEFAQRLLDGSDRAIQSVLLDGAELPVWPEEPGRSLEGVDEVHVMTVAVDQLLSETAQSAVAYLPRLEEGIGQAAQHFLAGQDQDGANLLGQAVAGLRWYTTFLANMARVGSGPQPDVEARVRALRDKLQEVVAVWEERDYGLLADLLQYELAPELAEARVWLGEWLRELDRTEE